MSDVQTAVQEATIAGASVQAPEGLDKPQGTPQEGAEPNEGEPAEGKPEDTLTPEQRRIRQLETRERRAREQIGRIREGREREALRAAELEREVNRLRGISGGGNVNHEGNADSDLVSLPRAEVNRRIQEAAERMAPDLASKQAEEVRLAQAAMALRDKVGAERFEQITAELADALPREHQLMLLRAKEPAALVQYLTDPDNAADLDALGSMDAFDAGQKVAEIRARLAAQKAENRQRSNAATPVEPIKGGGVSIGGAPNPSDTVAWIRHQNERERAALRRR